MEEVKQDVIPEPSEETVQTDSVTETPAESETQEAGQVNEDTPDVNEAKQTITDTSETQETQQPDTDAEAPASEEQAELPNDVEILKEMVTTLTARIEEMNKLFKDRIAYCEYEQKIVDNMHAELQKYKQDMNFQIIKPILMDVIDMRNSMLMNAKLYRNKPENEQKIPLDTFLTFAEGDAENILLQNDIIIHDAQIGDVFNPAKERVAKKVKTDNPQLHSKIADTMGSGYERDGKVIYPQKVAVYFYEKPAEPVIAEETVAKEEKPSEETSKTE